MKLLIILIVFNLSLFANIFNVKSFQADFKQTITNNSSKQILYTGKIYLKDTNKVLWSYKEPIIKNVIINKNILIVDEPELEQAIVSNINDDLNLVKILRESKKINNDTYTNTINNIKYTIKTYQDKLNAVFYTDDIGNSVKIVFSNEIINKNINDDIFEFKFPVNYDIIRK